MTVRLAATSALVALALTASVSRAEDDPRTAAKFLQGLRDRGYYDLAAEYLEALRGQPGTPADLATVIDYELGRILVDEASRSGDLVRRKELLEQARGKLDAFTKAHADHPKAPDALVQLARLLVERGHLAVVQSEDAEAKAEKEAMLAEARGSFDEARAAYEKAIKALSDQHAKYRGFIADGDPRRDERDRIHTSLMDAQLKRAVVDYEQGQTYALGSRERNDLMGKALAQFDDLYKKYRTMLAGLTARMWLGKCYEERGDLNPAMGVYNELMEHADPRLRPLQRHVGYFRIIVLGRRKEYALAADEAVRWLQANNANELLRSKEGLGVQFELAKDLLAQLPDVKSENERNAAMKRVIDLLGQIVRYPSPFKGDALTLLKKYKPSAAAVAGDVSKMNYEDAASQAEQAFATEDWDKAAALYAQAIRRAEAARDLDKTNAARFSLALVYYKSKRYYEAAVLADHLVRRYPQADVSARASGIALAAYADAYNTYTKVDRNSDLANLVDVAKFAAETYPEMDQGDTARMMLGQIYSGTGKHSEAVAAYEAVRPKSSKWADARTEAGTAHFDLSKALRREGKTAEADAEVEKARAVLNQGLKWRREAGHPPTDPGLIDNACDLADLDLETGKGADALKLLDPIAAQQKVDATGPAFTRLTATRLQAHVAVGQVDLALADMASLEKAGGGAGLTQLYYKLGKLLEKDMDARKAKGDSAGLQRTRDAYMRFLTTLAASKSGQTYDSLQWAGESLLTLDRPKEAQAVFERALKLLEADDKAAGANANRSLRTRLRLSTAYRDQKSFGESESLVSQLLQEFPNRIEPMMEQGMLLEAQAAAKKGKWATAFAHGRATALKLSRLRTKPPEYYDAWYHAAVALDKDGKAKEAKQTLASVLRLTPAVGGPEMKAKYQAMLTQIK